ncbi:MAG: DHH family phosphoesterase, partial [Crenarchaeota archaeon]|nr:DHH family phosphoesterase [Thermoproteota archaeon]
PNASTFDEVLSALRGLVASGVRVEWYDHHRWEEAWVKSLAEAGVRVHVDVTTCAAGVVARYAPGELEAEPDEFVARLVSATCAADLWRWDDPLAGRLYRVVDRYKGPRGDEWKRKLIRGFYEGSLWWPDLDEALEEYLRLEFKGFLDAERNVMVREFGGCRVVFVLKRPGPPNASILGNSLLSRYQADVAVIVRRRGRGMSLRSREVNVREIAYALGGGGHPRAAGAPLKLPLLYRLASIVYPRIRLRYAARLIEDALKRLGGCPR